MWAPEPAHGASTCAATDVWVWPARSHSSASCPLLDGHSIFPVPSPASNALHQLRTCAMPTHPNTCSTGEHHVIRNRQHCACWPWLLSKRSLQPEKQTLLRHVRSESFPRSPPLTVPNSGKYIISTGTIPKAARQQIQNMCPEQLPRLERSALRGRATTSNHAGAMFLHSTVHFHVNMAD